MLLPAVNNGRRNALEPLRLEQPAGEMLRDEIVQFLHRDRAALAAGLAVGADKILRLHACSDWFENGRVLLPERAPWLNDCTTELIGFLGVKYDDQVDSTTQALDYLREPGIAA
jgi:predicted phage terminase large subunit-like protein